MSASDSFGSFGEVASEFPISPDEARVISDALSPAQDVAGVGSSLGSAMSDAPGAGPQLVGVILQNLSVHLDLAAVSIETLARMANFYASAQKQTATELFPPPNVAAQQVRQDFQPLIDLARDPPF